jgi:CheY-like chemotaxis protein
MLKILLVTSNKDNLAELGLTLGKNGVQLSWAISGQEALDFVGKTPPDLVISDEKLRDMTGLELVLKSLSVNVMVNHVVVSSLSPEDFHEASEGLGVLLQLPPNPDVHQADRILDHLKRVSGFLSPKPEKS